VLCVIGILVFIDCIEQYSCTLCGTAVPDIVHLIAFARICLEQCINFVFVQNVV